MDPCRHGLSRSRDVERNSGRLPRRPKVAILATVARYALRRGLALTTEHLDWNREIPLFWWMRSTFNFYARPGRILQFLIALFVEVEFDCSGWAAGVYSLSTLVFLRSQRIVLPGSTPPTSFEPSVACLHDATRLLLPSRAA